MPPAPPSKENVPLQKVIVPKVNNEISTIEENTTTVKKKRELPKSSSMGAIFKGLHEEYVSTDTNLKVELTPETTQQLWNSFLAENKNTLQNSFLNAAQGQVPQLVEDKIVFIVSNNISLELLQLHKMDITMYFRKHTTSVNVAPDFILQREEQIKVFKSPKERLKDIIDVNPAVLNLIQKLDLNMD